MTTRHFSGRSQVLRKYIIMFDAFHTQHYKLSKNINIPNDTTFFIEKRHYANVGFMNIIHITIIMSSYK